MCSCSCNTFAIRIGMCVPFHRRSERVCVGVFAPPRLPRHPSVGLALPSHPQPPAPSRQGHPHAFWLPGRTAGCLLLSIPAQRLRLFSPLFLEFQQDEVRLRCLGAPAVSEMAVCIVQRPVPRPAHASCCIHNATGAGDENKSVPASNPFLCEALPSPPGPSFDASTTPEGVLIPQPFTCSMHAQPHGTS